MKKPVMLAMFGMFSVLLQNCYGQSSTGQATQTKKSTEYSHTDTSKLNKNNSDWQKILSPEVYQVARLKGTERPFTSEFEHSKEIARFVGTRSSRVTLSMKVDAAGRVSLSLLTKSRLLKQRITVWA
jgi:hypothetical protein